jgi:hypothetical protein
MIRANKGRLVLCNIAQRSRRMYAAAHSALHGTLHMVLLTWKRFCAPMYSAAHAQSV